MARVDHVTAIRNDLYHIRLTSRPFSQRLLQKDRLDRNEGGINAKFDIYWHLPTGAIHKGNSESDCIDVSVSGS